MNMHRTASRFARLVLAWFVLAIGVAMVSPLVKPVAMELICSSPGTAKLFVKTDAGLQPVAGHSLECPLCLLVDAPPAAPQVRPAGPHFQRMVLRLPRLAPIARRAAAPLPARGPPDFS